MEPIIFIIIGLILSVALIQIILILAYIRSPLYEEHSFIEWLCAILCPCVKCSDNIFDEESTTYSDISTHLINEDSSEDSVKIYPINKDGYAKI